MGLFIGTEAELAASRKKARSKGGKAFDKEFARQKAKGAKNFTFGGKSYSTKLAGGGTAKSTMAAVKPKGASGPTALAKKTTALPKPAPRSAASGLPDKGVPLPKSAPRGPNASVSSDVPTPTRKPWPSSSQRPDNVGNTPAPRAQKPVYFGPTEQRTPDERKAATKKAMESAQQRTKDQAAKRQMDRNTPPKPTAFAKPAPTGMSPEARSYVEKAKARVAAGQHPTLRAINRPPDNVGNRPSVAIAKRTVVGPARPAGVTQPLSAQQKLDRAMSQAKARSAVADKRGERTGDVTRFATATVKPVVQPRVAAAPSAANQPARVATTTTAKTGRLARAPVASVKTTAVAPKGDRLKKKVNVDDVFKKRW